MSRFRFKVLVTALLMIVGHVSPAAANQTRYVDVVTVSWPGARNFTVTTDSIESAITNEVNPRWRGFTTLEGDVKARLINFVHGETLRETIFVARPMPCEGSGSGSFMSSIQIEAYKRLAISDWATRYLIILVPNAGCIWMGRALLGSNEYPGGAMTLHDSNSAFVIAHELGHNLGLGHSNFLRCDSGKNDGAWGSDCKAVEYGGAIDVMSNVDVSTPLSTFHQWRMGLLDRDEIRQSWLNESIELSASDVVGGARAIFLRDGKSTYWVEYRRADNKGVYRPGLVIYRTDPPPASAIVSPNPEDSMLSEIPQTVAADYWMLNWDNYTYARSRSSGSMTLPQGETATVFSGNIQISASATSSANKVLVKVTRKTDTTPPPVPVLTGTEKWQYPGIEILQRGYDDGESAIASFEVQIDDKEIPLPVREVADWKPTYLNPFSAPKTLEVRDLPEGSYMLRVRAIDLWGNKSEWSAPARAVIDRSDPVLKEEIEIRTVRNGNFDLRWKGISDSGSGICLTEISNEDGWVTYRSNAKSEPSLSIPTTGTLNGSLRVFDCLGNGKGAQVSLQSSYLNVTKAKRTGKWSPADEVAEGAMRCNGRCAAIFTTLGNVGVLAASGAAQVVVSSEPVANIPLSTSNELRIGASVQLGAKNKILRVTGSNFTLVGLARIDLKLNQVVEIDRKPPVEDSSITDPAQLALSRYGFNQNDFTQEWSVLPMARGTTLLDPTLDLCGSNYTSESGREVRRQLSVTRTGSPYLFLSTEVVKYRNVAAANAALAELKRNYASCVTNKGGNENGVFTTYVFQPLLKSNAKLVEEANRVVVRATIGTGTSARQLLAVYQYNGALFTGLYIVKAGEKAIEDGEVLRWFEVAEVLATRLSESKSI